MNFEQTVANGTMQAINIKTEMLQPDVPETSISMLHVMEKWRAHIQEPMLLFASKILERFTQEIFLHHTKTFKAKTVHRNSGSMRKRRARHVRGRMDKVVTVKVERVKGFYPSSGELVMERET